MLQQVGLGIAMGNSKPAVQRIAKYVTRTNNEDGVGEVLRAILSQR